MRQHTCSTPFSFSLSFRIGSKAFIPSDAQRRRAHAQREHRVVLRISFDAHAVQVESMDFASLMGDVVPRDGLQRPILTSGSPVRARASRRDDSRPTHVTHVHQTIIQASNSAPIAVAVEATAAEGTSGLSHLERALRVPRGSIHAPASRWKHRSKAMVAAGMPAHQHDGSMQCGSMLIAPIG